MAVPATIYGMSKLRSFAEILLTCAVSNNIASFLPITLEQMARDRGVLLSDKETPCSAAWPSDGQRLARRHPGDDGSGPASSTADNENACIIYFLGAEVNTASFAMYAFSISVLVQSLLIISISAAADHGLYRKTFLLVFAVVGSVATMLFLPLPSDLYVLAAFLAVVANTCFGGSFVLLNSFLPLLVRNHPDTLQSLATENNADDSTAASAPQPQVPNGHAESSPSPKLVSAELELSTKISSNGMGIGYTAAVIVQISSILLVLATQQTTFSLRLVLFVIGLWWLVFTLPSALWLRPRPGPPLPATQSGRGWWAAVQYLIFAWKSLGRTALHARHLKDVLIFLAAWFLLSDGIATVSGTAVLFAKTELNMDVAALGMINVIVTISGVCGALSWSYVSRRLGMQAVHTIIACICLFETIPLYAFLGFIPAIKDLGVIGLQQPWEMYPMSAVYGIVMGGLSSYCRSFFGELIPPGFEASFYALYAITDKGSSIFGPAIVGAIIDRYGEIRPAFVFLACLIIVPLPLMLLVDVDRGKRDAAALAHVLEELGSDDHRQQQQHGYMPVADTHQHDEDTLGED